MELTRIETENLEGFMSFLPSDLLTEEDQAVGVLSGEGEPLGAAVFSPTENSIDLKWIFVDPEERRKGVATLILHDAMTLLQGRVPMLTVSYYDEAEGLEALRVHLGFAITEGDPVYTIPTGVLLEKPKIRMLAKRSYPDTLISLANAPSRSWGALHKLLDEEAGGTVFLENIDPEYSFVTESADQKLLGCILVGRSGDFAEVKLLLNTHRGNPEQLLWALAKKCREEEEVRTLCFVAASPKVEQMAEWLLDKEKGCKKHLRLAVAAL